MFRILLTLLHVIVSMILILVVLLQTGKRADLAGAFGGGGSQTAFGTRGAATFLSKATTVSAVIFMVTSLALAIVSSRRDRIEGTVLDEVTPPAATAPATPGEPAQEAPAGSELPSDDEESTFPEAGEE